MSSFTRDLTGCSGKKFSPGLLRPTLRHGRSQACVKPDPAPQDSGFHARLQSPPSGATNTQLTTHGNSVRPRQEHRPAGTCQQHTARPGKHTAHLAELTTTHSHLRVMTKS